MTIKRIALVCLTLAGVIALPFAVMRAQSNEPAGRAESLAQELDTQFSEGHWLDRLREHQSQQAEGSWEVTVTPAVPPGVPQPPPMIAHATNARGGGLITSDRQRSSTISYGTWAHLGGNEFATTATGDIFDAAGNFAGTFKVRCRFMVTGKDESVGVANVEQRDASGNLVFNRCATYRGKRIAIEPLAPQCESLAPPR
jgi:hypothetical protein